MGRPVKSDNPVELLALLHEIGGNIAASRMKKGISQAALARMAEISITTLNEIETRRCRDIRLSTLMTIATTLELPVTHLLKQSDLKMKGSDKAQLLNACDAILRITRKIRV